MSCSPDCWRVVQCKVCIRRKAPRGRSVATEAASGYCTSDCSGYYTAPQPPHLWSENDPDRAYFDKEWKPPVYPPMDPTEDEI